jgi:hypothetical protein
MDKNPHKMAGHIDPLGPKNSHSLVNSSIFQGRVIFVKTQNHHPKW